MERNDIMLNTSRMIRKAARFAGIFLVGLLLFAVQGNAQTGHVLSGVGAVDEGMAGVGTANPQDGLSALHWNPAAITGFERTSIDVSLQILSPTGHISSRVDQNAFGSMGPGQTMQGETSSEAGPFMIPALGIIYVPDHSRFRFGFSALGVGGFGVDYKTEMPNAITTPQPPNGMGFGAIRSEFQLLQLVPTVAYQLTDKLSVGFAPVYNVSTLEVNPFPGASPDDANNDYFPSYPKGPRTSASGFGYQAGLQLRDLAGFHLGLTYKSTQKFNDLNFDSYDESGNERTFSFNMDYPRIISFGIGYSGIAGLELMGDIRYIDFENTDGFREAGFDQTGAITGFGWKSIMVYALGLQYSVTDRLPVRFGYSYNQNPIRSEYAFYNVSSPAIVEHHLSGGLSYKLSRISTLSLAAQYGFENSIHGEWVNPQMGSIAGTDVENRLSTLFLVAGVSFGL